MPRQFDEYLRRISAINVLFAISSIALLVSIVWMVMDDYSRSWKGYQREFQRIQAAGTASEIQKAESALDPQELEAQRAAIAAARQGLDQKAADVRSAGQRLAEVETASYRDDLAYRTTKSRYDAKKFDYEEARHQESSRSASLQAEMEQIWTALEDLRVRNLEHDKAREAAQKALAELTAGLDEANRKLAQMTADVSRLEKNLDSIAPKGLMKAAVEMLNAPLLDFVAPTLKIQQVVLENVPIDINFTHIPRADRCQTCHLGADRAGFEEAPQPFRTHSRIELFTGGSSPHPVSRFGCTPCHQGRDRGVDFTLSNHTPDSEAKKGLWEKQHDWERDHYWDFPMLALSRTEAGCLKCHQGVAEVPQAPHLNRGLAIVERVGCYGCHKIRGFEDRPKVAPPLTRITAKTTPAWMATWIKDPKAFRPSTRMPRFFGLPNHQEAGDHEREDAEILGIVAYLTSKAETPKYPDLPGRGNPDHGRDLVLNLGCMGCHAIEKLEVPDEVLAARDRRETADPIAFERRFGPDLSRVGAKLSPRWIFQWVQNPHSYNPASRMPSLRLSREEALDVTAFLLTLKDERPAGERVDPPVANPEARDRALRAYLTQRMTPEDADAQLGGLSDHARDILLGEKTIARYGCFGCHLIPGFETTPPIGVDLSDEGSKHASLLYFGYVPIEHNAPAWFFQKVRSPRSFDQGKDAVFYDRLRMPQFGFTDDEAAAVTTVLQALTKEKVPLESTRRLSAPEQAVERGRRLIRDHNCRGCHVYEEAGGAIRQSLARTMAATGMNEDEARATAIAFSPPIIDGEGAKVQPEWLFEFLRNPSPIRPWLKVRMPTFGFDDRDASDLVHHFAAKENRPFPFQTLPATAPQGAELKAALTLFGPDYFNCWNCHQQGARKPSGPPEGWAPDLMLAHQRLNPDWIARWIENPQKLMPGTRMPTYFDPEDMEGSAPPDVLGGDPRRQIDALRDYIFSLGMKQGGPGSGARR